MKKLTPLEEFNAFVEATGPTLAGGIDMSQHYTLARFTKRTALKPTPRIDPERLKRITASVRHVLRKPRP